MDEKEFREFGKAAVDFIANYNETLRDRDVLPSIKPGYLTDLIPQEAPQTSESWQQILEDVEKHILPGVTHWHSPHFHAYFPTANSYPAIVGDILSTGIGCIGFSWLSSPACTELEMITMDWLVKLMGLPEYFLNSSDGPGGGVLQGWASESIFITLAAARETTVNRIKKERPELDEGTIRAKLVAYTSDQANLCVEKAGILGAMQMRHLSTDVNCSLRGTTLLDQVKKDIENGLIPSVLIATLGTTSTCAFDKLDELGPICQKYNIWFHIDAAYAGAALVCPEYRYLMNGIEYVDSFTFNPHKWLLVNADCSALWMKDARLLTEAFKVDNVYIANKEGKPKAELEYDYRHWQVALGRRFRSLKLWLVLRSYGVEGLQKHIRHSVEMANQFKDLVNKDDRFEIPVEPNLGLVCFKIKGDDALTKELLRKISLRRKINLMPGMYHDQLMIRFVICSRFIMPEDIQFAWDEITSQTSQVLIKTNE